MDFYPCFEEERFEHYMELPQEIRLMVIERMEAMDRCRFTQCARWTSREAKMTKRYRFSLEIDFLSQFYVRAMVRFANNEGQWCHGYNIEFEFRLGATYIQCTSLWGLPHWSMRLTELKPLPSHAVDFMQEIVEFNQKCIRRLSITGCLFNRVTAIIPLEVFCVRNLEELVIEDNVDLLPIIRNIQHPLKSFECLRNRTVYHLTRSNEIYKVTGRLIMPHLRMFYEDFRRLSAARIRVNIGYLTPLDVYRFIDAWQSSDSNLEVCEWDIDGGMQFDDQEVFRLLGGNDTELNHICRKTVSHHYDPRRTADFMSAGRYRLAFVVNGLNH